MGVPLVPVWLFMTGGTRCFKNYYCKQIRKAQKMFNAVAAIAAAGRRFMLYLIAHQVEAENVSFRVRGIPSYESFFARNGFGIYSFVMGENEGCFSSLFIRTRDGNMRSNFFAPWKSAKIRKINFSGLRDLWIFSSLVPN